MYKLHTQTFFDSQLTGKLIVALHLLKEVCLPLPSSESSLEVLDGAAVAHVLRHQLTLEAVQLPLGLHQERGDAGETRERVTIVCMWNKSLCRMH